MPGRARILVSLCETFQFQAGVLYSVRKDIGHGGVRMRWSYVVVVAVCQLGAISTPAARAEVGDPTLQTNHPYYPGEGVFQTPESCVRYATRDAGTDHERALALFNWILTHQWHLAAPQEWNRPGLVPGANPDDSEMVVYDANRGRFSYGYGLCGTVHAWNEVYWRALGFPARRRAFPGHTNSEVFVDGAWRAFDTDMAGIVFNLDGTVAGYDHISRDLSLVDRPMPPWPS